MWVFEATDEKLAAEGNVHVHVTVHGVFRQQVDAELLARFREAPLAVEGEDIGVDATPAVVVHQVEELNGHFSTRLWKRAVDSGTIIVVNTRVLVVQGTVEDATTQGLGVEHAGDEWFKFYVAMI